MSLSTITDDAFLSRLPPRVAPLTDSDPSWTSCRPPVGAIFFTQDPLPVLRDLYENAAENNLNISSHASTQLFADVDGFDAGADAICSAIDPEGDCGYKAVARKTAWRRPFAKQLVGENGVLASDINQKNVGDCWLLGTVAAVAQQQHSSAPVNSTPGTVNWLPELGCFSVRLCVETASSPAVGEWVYLLLDDCIPCLSDEECSSDDIYTFCQVSSSSSPTTPRV